MQRGTHAFTTTSLSYIRISTSTTMSQPDNFSDWKELQKPALHQKCLKSLHHIICSRRQQTQVSKLKIDVFTTSHPCIDPPSTCNTKLGSVSFIKNKKNMVKLHLDKSYAECVVQSWWKFLR
jgi:hypothetical protein